MTGKLVKEDKHEISHAAVWCEECGFSYGGLKMVNGRFLHSDPDVCLTTIRKYGRFQRSVYLRHDP